MTLRRYVGINQGDQWGRAGWFGKHLEQDWSRGKLTPERIVPFAHGPLRKWRTGRQYVLARETFTISKVRWNRAWAYDQDRNYAECRYSVLLLRSVETVHGRVVEPPTVVGNYDVGACTTLSLTRPYRGRGLGKTFLLAAQQLVSKAHAPSDLTQAGYANRRAAHRLAVEQTVKAGKTVPLKVLMDYPELVRRYAKRHLTTRKGARTRSVPSFLDKPTQR